MTLKKLAVVCLTVYGLACLYFGINHLVVFTIATIIGGIAGYEIRKHRE